MDVFPLAIGLTTVTFFSTLAGGAVAIRYRRDLVLFLAFAGGALIAVSFFDLLPGAIQIAGQLAFVNYLLMAAVVGFLYYFVTQKTIAIHSHGKAIHGESDAELGYVGAASTTLHSWFDGFGIGVSLQANFAIGLIVATAVILHDFSDGLNTATLMLRTGNSLRATRAFLLADSGAPLVGAVFGSLIAIAPYLISYILAFFAGEFLAIGASDLLPEAHAKEPSWRLIAVTLLGVGVVFLLTRFA